MIKEIENCFSIDLLKQKRRTKEKCIEADERFIKACDVKIQQLEHAEKYQVRLDI